MKLARPKREATSENVIPLINVVFLLLIFFMLAGKLSQPDPFPVDPPASRSQDPSGAQEIVVYVAGDGRIAVDGGEVALDAVPETVRAAREETKGPVRLKADSGADANRVIAVMERLRQAEVREVVLLTLPQERR